jgi:uncharacterized SAM-binding protein YcdF (DUF218 family)
MTRRHSLRLALGVLAALAGLWLGGFVWFLRTAERLPPPPPQADGIVALTGGAGRVEAALRLLAEGRARVALISGVGGAAAFEALARRAGIDRDLRPRVTLGRAAQSTRGNAEETAAWARANAVRSLIVVTAGYHMPRALAELARTLPDVALYPAAVPAAASWRLMAAEYGKWLAAELGLSGFGRHGVLQAEHGG